MAECLGISQSCKRAMQSSLSAELSLAREPEALERTSTASTDSTDGEYGTASEGDGEEWALPEGVPERLGPSRAEPEPEPEVDQAFSTPRGARESGAASESHTQAATTSFKLRAGGWKIYEHDGGLHLYHQASDARAVLPAAEGDERERCSLDFPFDSFGASWRPEELPQDKTVWAPLNAGFEEMVAGQRYCWGDRRGGHCWNLAFSSEQGVTVTSGAVAAMKETVETRPFDIFGEEIADAEMGLVRFSLVLLGARTSAALCLTAVACCAGLDCRWRRVCARRGHPKL